MTLKDGDSAEQTKATLVIYHAPIGLETEPKDWIEVKPQQTIGPSHVCPAVMENITRRKGGILYATN